MNLKLRAIKLTAEGSLTDARIAWLAATQEEIARLIVEPGDFGFGEALACLISARHPLLDKETVRMLVSRTLTKAKGPRRYPKRRKSK